MNRIRVFGPLVLAGAAALVPAPLRAQQVRPGLPGSAADSARNRRGLGVIDGGVSDANLAPIQGAQLYILRTHLRLGTGPTARFRSVDVPPGQYLVIVRRLGYRPTSAIV